MKTASVISLDMQETHSTPVTVSVATTGRVRTSILIPYGKLADRALILPFRLETVRKNGGLLLRRAPDVSVPKRAGFHRWFPSGFQAKRPNARIQLAGASHFDCPIFGNVSGKSTLLWYSDEEQYILPVKDWVPQAQRLPMPIIKDEVLRRHKMEKVRFDGEEHKAMVMRDQQDRAFLAGLDRAIRLAVVLARGDANLSNEQIVGMVKAGIAHGVED